MSDTPSPALSHASTNTDINSVASSVASCAPLPTSISSSSSHLPRSLSSYHMPNPPPQPRDLSHPLGRTRARAHSIHPTHTPGPPATALPSQPSAAPSSPPLRRSSVCIPGRSYSTHQMPSSPLLGPMRPRTSHGLVSREAPTVGTVGLWMALILDESGSMDPVRDATIENFNKYISEQRKLQQSSSVQSQSQVSAAQDELDIEIEGAAATPAPMDMTPRDGAHDVDMKSEEPSASSLGAVPQGHPQRPPDLEPHQQGSGAIPPAAVAQGNFVGADLCLVSLLKFAAPQLKEVYSRKPIAEVPLLSRHNYTPSGGTNLMDAIGHTIESIDLHLLSFSDPLLRPAVLIVIITDGEENHSTKYTMAEIRQLIGKRQQAGWTFVFLGANMDAWSAAAQVGISSNNSFNFDSAQQGSMVSGLSHSTSHWRRNTQSAQYAVQQSPPCIQRASHSVFTTSVGQSPFFDSQSRTFESPSSRHSSSSHPAMLRPPLPAHGHVSSASSASASAAQPIASPSAP